MTFLQDFNEQLIRLYDPVTPPINKETLSASFPPL